MNGSKTKHLAHVKMKLKFEIINIWQNCLGQKEVGSATYWCYPAEKRSECSNESHAALGELEMFQGEEFQCWKLIIWLILYESYLNIIYF